VADGVEGAGTGFSGVGGGKTWLLLGTLLLPGFCASTLSPIETGLGGLGGLTFGLSLPVVVVGLSKPGGNGGNVDGLSGRSGS
jgi:hypothetical protein